MVVAAAAALSVVVVVVVAMRGFGFRQEVAKRHHLITLGIDPTSELP